MKHPFPLRYSISVLLLLLGGVLVGGVTWMDVRSTSRRIEADARRQLVSLGNRTSGTIENYYSRGETHQVERTAAILGTEPNMCLALVCDEADRVLAGTTPEFLGRPLAETPARGAARLFVRGRQTMVAQIRLSPDGGTLAGVFPFRRGLLPGELRPSRVGALYLEYDLRVPKQAALAETVWRAGLMGGIVLLLLLAVWQYLHVILNRRAAELISVAREMAGGNLAARATLDGSDELARLGESFNQMASGIQAQATALRESEMKYRRLHESMMDAFVSVGMDGKILEFNRAYEEMLGYTDEELRQLTYPEMTPACWHAAEARIVAEQILPRGYSDVYEKEYRRKDGTVFPVELRAFLIRDEWGTPLYIWGIVRDITARKQAEKERAKLQEQLTQAQKMESVGRLAGGVAHDFNNLLTGIMGCVDICRESIPEGHPIRGYLDEISADAERSADLTRQLLAFARKQIIIPKVMNLNDTVEGMLKLLRRLIGEEISMVWVPGIDLWEVKMDRSQVEQLLANLCVNSRDAIAGVGKITIETANVTLDGKFCAENAETLAGEYVLLSVTDSGCGMDAETLSHIFDPFFTTKGLGHGTGLGLATVFGIVKQNNGVIKACSNPGDGTTFKVYLPRCTEAITASQTPAVVPATQLRGTETILLAEDEKTVRNTMRIFLEELGYTVLAAENPALALKVAAQTKVEIQLLLTDVVMPGMSGRELADRLRMTRPGIRCLFMSGYTADIVGNHGVLDNEISFIAKPCSREDLARKVRQVLDAEREPRREAGGGTNGKTEERKN